MSKLINFIKQLYFAVKIISSTIAAPVISVVRETLAGRPVGIGLLTFAIWRLFVWVFFVLCAFASVGVPATMAFLFLIDLAIVGVQIVSQAVKAATC